MARPPHDSVFITVSAEMFERVEREATDRGITKHRLLELALAPALGVEPGASKRQRRRAIQFSDACYKRITAAAARRNISRSQLVELALAGALGTRPPDGSFSFAAAQRQAETKRAQRDAARSP
jgi:hypothetical protein